MVAGRELGGDFGALVMNYNDKVLSGGFQGAGQVLANVH